MKKKPVGTVVEFEAEIKDHDRNEQMLKELRTMFGPPGCQPGRRWYRRSLHRWRLVEARHMTGNPVRDNLGQTVLRNESYWVMRLYFRNPADATMVELKFR